MKTPSTILGLLGRNVGYSYSPLIHNKAAELLGLPYCYTIFDITDHLLIPTALAGARALGIAGFNVTIPYKQTVLSSMDELSPQAKATGAVNTIRNDNGKLYGYNTDIAGVSRPLLPYLDRIANNRVGIFGCGGAARAAVVALRDTFAPSAVTLFVRSPEKAVPFISDLGTPPGTAPLNAAPVSDLKGIQECTLLINATPIGTKGSPGEGSVVLPSGTSGIIHAGQIVFDMVYNPLETPLLQLAAAEGATAVPGIEMLLAQAAESFSIWTGRTMPTNEVRRALLEELSLNS